MMGQRFADGTAAASGRVSLRRRTSAPRIARRLVRDMCAGAALPDALVDDAVHVTSELVATSVREGRTAIDVVVELEPGVVTVRVQNEVTNRRSSARGGSRRADGRRDIIKRLSTSWGYYRAGARHEHWASFRTPQAQYLLA